MVFKNKKLICLIGKPHPRNLTCLLVLFNSYINLPSRHTQQCITPRTEASLPLARSKSVRSVSSWLNKKVFDSELWCSIDSHDIQIASDSWAKFQSFQGEPSWRVSWKTIASLLRRRSCLKRTWLKYC